MMRLRIHFMKTDAMRYTSHLDLHKAWERTFRRAGLPLAYTQGFNPHPRINLASALPLGFTGEDEIVDVWLEQALSGAQVREALTPALPPGLALTRVDPIDEHLPTLQTVLASSEYSITLLQPVPHLEERMQQLLSASELPRQRRGKHYDLRPLLLDLRSVPDDDQGRQRIMLRLTAQEGATGRPEEVLDALGVSPENTRVHRTRLNFQTG